MKLVPSPGKHKWAFTARFRHYAFGWRSQPAIQRIKQAVSESKSVARLDSMFAADGREHVHCSPLHAGGDRKIRKASSPALF